MSPILSTAYRVAWLLLAAGTLAGCGTPRARDFGGAWHPANTFPARPTAIPLHPAYTFYAAPMDGTLKTMLARWARDTRRELAYRPSMDLTLYTGVAGVRTTDLDAAVAKLNRLYAAQDIVIAATGQAIVVDGAAGKSRPARQAAPAPTPAQAVSRQAQPNFPP